MVGTTKYTDEEIAFILCRTVREIPRGETNNVHLQTVQDFRKRFNKPGFGLNQVRYVTERYGGDPNYGNRWAKLRNAHKTEDEEESSHLPLDAIPTPAATTDHPGGRNNNSAPPRAEIVGTPSGPPADASMTPGAKKMAQARNKGKYLLCVKCGGSGVVAIHRPEESLVEIPAPDPVPMQQQQQQQQALLQENVQQAQAAQRQMPPQPQPGHLMYPPYAPCMPPGYDPQAFVTPHATQVQPGQNQAQIQNQGQLHGQGQQQYIDPRATQLDSLRSYYQQPVSSTTFVAQSQQLPTPNNMPTAAMANQHYGGQMMNIGHLDPARPSTSASLSQFQHLYDQQQQQQQHMGTPQKVGGNAARTPNTGTVPRQQVNPAIQELSQRAFTVGSSPARQVQRDVTSQRYSNQLQPQPQPQHQHQAQQQLHSHHPSTDLGAAGFYNNDLFPSTSTIQGPGNNNNTNNTLKLPDLELENHLFDPRLQYHQQQYQYQSPSSSILGKGGRDISSPNAITTTTGNPTHEYGRSGQVFTPPSLDSLLQTQQSVNTTFQRDDWPPQMTSPPSNNNNNNNNDNDVFSAGENPSFPDGLLLLSPVSLTGRQDSLQTQTQEEQRPQKRMKLAHGNYDNNHNNNNNHTSGDAPNDNVTAHVPANDTVQNRYGAEEVTHANTDEARMIPFPQSDS